MIIPVRCFSCGKPIGHLWEEFKKRTAEGENAKKVLDEWHRVLKNGGKLKVSVPSFEIMLHVISMVGITKWVFDMLWGNQDDEYGFHYVCFSRELLVKNLKSVGFRNIEVVEKLNKNSKDRSTAVVVSSDKRINGLPVSLNVVAEK